MNQATQCKPDCYGNIFPDLRTFSYNRIARGKVFSVLVKSFGIGVQSRDLTIDTQAWEACQVCPQYRGCYDLSMAKLAMEEAIRRL